MLALCMGARLTVVQCFGSRASGIFFVMEMVARRNAKQGFQSSLEEVRLAKDFSGDVRQLWPLFLHYFRRRVLRCSISWCRMLHFEEWTQVSLVSIQRCQCERVPHCGSWNRIRWRRHGNGMTSVVPSPNSDTSMCSVVPSMCSLPYRPRNFVDIP